MPPERCRWRLTPALWKCNLILLGGVATDWKFGLLGATTLAWITGQSELLVNDQNLLLKWQLLTVVKAAWKRRQIPMSLALWKPEPVLEHISASAALLVHTLLGVQMTLQINSFVVQSQVFATVPSFNYHTGESRTCMSITSSVILARNTTDNQQLGKCHLLHSIGLSCQATKFKSKDWPSADGCCCPSFPNPIWRNNMQNRLSWGCREYGNDSYGRENSAYRPRTGRKMRQPKGDRVASKRFLETTGEGESMWQRLLFILSAKALVTCALPHLIASHRTRTVDFLSSVWSVSHVRDDLVSGRWKILKKKM